MTNRFVRATTRLLRSLGFIAKGFSSADEFLKSNRLQITSCLIADVQMPETSGLALYGQLVASGNPIPTVLITAYPDDAIRARALSAGVAAYLVKPFSEKELLGSSIDTRAQAQGAACADQPVAKLRPMVYREKLRKLRWRLVRKRYIVCAFLFDTVK